MARRGDACIVVIDVDDIVLHDNITQVKTNDILFHIYTYSYDKFKR